MLTILFYLVFIFSVAFASFGIALASRLRNNYRSEIFTSLLYFQVFIFTFGFYGIWGQVLMRTFLFPYISPELYSRFSNIALLMGLPFLVFAWLMLIQFSAAVSGREKNIWFLPVFLILNFSLLFILGYFIARENSSEPETLNRYYFIIMNLAYSLLASYIIHLARKSRAVIHESGRKVLAPLISIISVIQCIPLFFYRTEPWMALIFIFIFFAGNIFLPVYLSYCTILPSVATEAQQDLTFDDFCKKYEISPRESDIIRQICNGLSNKEISEKLFISLQTVKDHTHRIYIKTNVKSRVQLINLVKGEKTV